MNLDGPFSRKLVSMTSVFTPGIHMYAAERASTGGGRDRDDEFYYLSFRLRDEFIEQYKTRTPKFGFPIGGGNTLGEYNWITKYSRRKLDGSKERFWEGCRRVIEGMYSGQKDHAIRYRLPWNEQTAHESAQEAYARLFDGKWSPPGRGLWMMGTFFVNGAQNSAALQNCAFLSTLQIDSGDPTFPFHRMMEMSMLGVGVGFDTRGAGKVAIHQPTEQSQNIVVIDDSREGWYESLALLLESYFKPHKRVVRFDYSKIRPAGAPIMGFGGVAAGFEPLIQLHRRLRDLLNYREGECVTAKDIVEIMNMIGKCVVAANVRSSAQIALDDTGDTSFLELKNPMLYPERMGFVKDEHGGPKADDNGIWLNSEEGGWGYTSNNSIITEVGANLDHLVNGMMLNGEPGVYWLDMCQQYGRLVDPPNGKDHRVAGVNPCLTGDSLILTKNGLVTIEELSGYEFDIFNGDGKFVQSTAWYSGIKPVYKVTLVNGLELKATKDHKIEILTRMDSKHKYDIPLEIEVGDLEPGMVVRSFIGSGDWEGLEPVTYSRAVAYGLLFGDGYRQVNRGKSVYLKTNESEVILFLQEEFGDRFENVSGSTYAIRDCIDELGNFGIELSPLPDRRLPKQILRWSPNLLRAFIKGLFSANGGAMPNYARLDLKTSNKTFAKDVQRILLALGYSCYITTNKATEIEWDNGVYTSKESYDVNVSGVWQYCKFQEEIGFLREHKSVRIPNGAYINKVTKVKSIEYIGEEPVYDFNEPITNFGWVNGIKTHNCGEQPLEHNELCTLVETYPTNCADLQDYLRTLKFAYLYGKTVTLLPTHWKETNEVMIRNRRIGTSMTGLAEFVEKHGWAELKLWQDKGYHEIRRWDVIYSEWLGIRESIKVTTVKPSGSVSLLFGVTPGCHWPKERGKYLRTVRETVNSAMAEAMQKAGYQVEPNVQNPQFGLVITCPTVGPDIRGERDVSIWEKAALAAQCQRWWSDNSVSVTVTFDPETESKEIPAILRAFDGQLKALTFLPSVEGVYLQAPYQRVKEEQWEEMFSSVQPLDWDALYAGEAADPQGERYCSNDVCEVPQ